ncbi:MAG: folylpolyglutamate synthase/dihydrofolate synthase family protein [Solibacillus sp.]
MIPLLNNYKDKWQVVATNDIKPGLDAMHVALERLQHPERDLQVIHIAGTNGKGSTLAFIEQMALAHGLKVGKFTSPCVKDVHDQIQVNAESITEQAMDVVFKQLADAQVSGLLTDFELLTCAAFLYFANEQVDIVLLEAGMGGRFDSTNVITPVVSIIPSIALEHTNFLGDTLDKIAVHKAGIIKEKKPVVVGRLPQQALDVVVAEAQQKNAPLVVLGQHIDVKVDARGDCYYHHQAGIIIPSLKRQLVGAHQADNLALALTAFLQFATQHKLDVDMAKIRQAVAQTFVAGRFEEVRMGLIFDGAHNPASVEKLVQTIQAYCAGKRVELVVGMLADKDIETALRLLEQVADAFYFVDFANERAAKAADIMKLSLASEKMIVTDVVAFLQQSSGENTVRIVTGSLYLLSEIRQQLEL